jgi:MFS family permease
MQAIPQAQAPGTAHRAAFIAAILTIFTTIFASNLPTPLYAVWQAQLGFSATALTGVFAVYVLGVIIMLPTAGPLSDLIGRRQVMIPGMVFTLLAAVAFAAADDVYWLAFGRFLTGLGTGAVTGAATAALVELDPRGNRTRAGSISALAFTAGATAGPLFSSLALRFLPWPALTPFLVMAALAVAAAVVLARVAWPSHVGRGRAGFRLRDWRPQRLSVPREILGGFAVAGAAVALTWSTGSLYASLGPTLAVELVGVSDRALAGLYAAAFQLVGGLAQFAFRQQPVRRLMTIAPGVLVGGMAISVCGIVAASPLLFTIGTITSALGCGATAVGSIGIVSLLAPEARRGEVMSAFYIVAYLTMASAVLGVGAASDWIGLMWTMIALTAVMIGIAATIIRTCLRRDPLAPSVSSAPTPAPVGPQSAG